MARTLTNLIPLMHVAMDTVSRELTGMIPAVSMDMSFARAAIGQSVYSPASAAATASNITPAVTPPDDGDNTPTAVAVAITKARRCPVRINGEQQLGLGPVWDMLRPDEFAQAMRTLVNEIEADLAGLYIYASRAIGTAGTAPFGTPKLGDAAAIESILDDNGAPQGDRSLIINSAAKESLALLTNLTSVAEAGSADYLRRGIVGEIFGLMVRKSAQVAAHTKGTGASATTNNAGYAVGSKSLTLAAAGTGTLVAGDVVTFAGDTTNKYVVTSGDTDVSDGGTLVLGAPGIRVAMSAATKAITVLANHACNLAFSRTAIKLATRAPAVPTEGDSATDAVMITDPVTGLTFEVREYRQYRQVQYEVSIAWGVAAVKPEHMAILLG
jgi:hypothetical protein